VAVRHSRRVCAGPGQPVYGGKERGESTGAAAHESEVSKSQQSLYVVWLCMQRTNPEPHLNGALSSEEVLLVDVVRGRNTVFWLADTIDNSDQGSACTIHPAAAPPPFSPQLVCQRLEEVGLEDDGKKMARV